jgi:hypothetical protein
VKGRLGVYGGKVFDAILSRYQQGEIFSRASETKRAAPVAALSFQSVVMPFLSAFARLYCLSHLFNCQ